MSEPSAESAGNPGIRKRMILLAILVAGVGLLYWRFGHLISIEYLAEREAELQALQEDSPVLVIGAAFLIYVTVTGLSLPGAALLSLVIGWFFGFWVGLVLVSFASTTGATVAFLLSRYFFRDAMSRRFGDRLTSFDESLEREGAFYLFTLRLIPVVPFFVINAVMGLTRIRTSTFWWVSQLGMFPGTVVYLYAGSRVPNLQSLEEKGIEAVFTPSQLIQITIAFVLLGVFPLATKWLLNYFRPATNQ